jgi:PAS domain-containing protein
VEEKLKYGRCGLLMFGDSSRLAGTILRPQVIQVVVDFRIIGVNPGRCKMTGQSREDLEGKLFSQTFPDTVKEGLVERNAQVLTTGIEFQTQHVGPIIDMPTRFHVCVRPQQIHHASTAADYRKRNHV